MGIKFRARLIDGLPLLTVWQFEGGANRLVRFKKRDEEKANDGHALSLHLGFCPTNGKWDFDLIVTYFKVKGLRE